MDSCENIVNREIKRRLLLENMYPQKTDFHIWKSQICQKFDIDNNSVEDVMLGSQLASTIRKKLRTQISAYLDTNFAKHKVPFLHGIAQGNNESPPSDKSIYLTDVQHLPLAYKNHAKLPGSSNTPGYRPDFPPQGRPIPTEFDGAQLSGLLQNTDVISQVFFVAFIRPWTGMIKESFVQQADLLDMKKWNVRMLVAAISLVSSSLARTRSSKATCYDGYIRIVRTVNSKFTPEERDSILAEIFKKCYALHDDDGCAPL